MICNFNINIHDYQGQLANGLVCVMMLLFAAAIFMKRSRRYSLAMQIAHLVTFFAPLMLATYLR